ncbi:hypothetical protein C0992_002246 [Termitomyces sp. T32_za158]|nr:hypothetical protein C0992_002246 [Termitomyces sp. T32_za158]
MTSSDTVSGEVSGKLEQDAVICVMSAAKIRAEFLKLENEAQGSWMRDRYKENLARLDVWRWGEELELIDDFRQWSSVKQPKDLTERIWLNIKNDLIAKLKEHKTLRLEKDQRVVERERLHRLSDWLSDLRYRSSTPFQKRILPRVAELRQMEPFSSLIMAPASEKVEFSRLMLEEATQNWRSSKEVELRDMIVSGSSPISGPTSVDILSLATTFFKCWSSICGNRTIGFPEVLVHVCMADYDRSWNNDGKRVFFDQKAHSLAKTILEASGLDYNIITREEVHRPDFYIECYGCPSTKRRNGERVLLGWHSAINHALRHSSQDTGLRMARVNLSNSELEVVKKLEVDQLISTRSVDYKCIRCEEPGFIGSRHALSEHVFHHHKRDGPLTYLQDYDFATDESGFRPQPADPLLLKPIDS